MITFQKSTRGRLLLILLLGVAAAAFGAQEPVSSRGFSAESVHQFGSVDNINIFNGNLTVTVPLGPVYMAGDRLSYRFTLVYNSQIWDYEDRCGIDTTTAHWFSPLRGNGPNSQLANCSTEAIPNRASNAGVGWMLTLGMMTDSATYISSDGASHTFYTANHPNGDIHTAAAMYTRDGTFLRLRRNSDTLRTIHFPDGTTQQFECGSKDNFADKSQCGTAPNREKQQFRLKKMSNPFGNEVTVDYGTEPAGVAGATWQWIVSEKAEGHFTTQHYINFRYNFIPGSNTAAAPYKWIIDSVDLSAPPASHTPGNEVTETRKGHYQFNYRYEYIPRPNGHDASQDFTQIQNSSKEGIYVPLLTGVTLPQPNGGAWNFDYYQPADSEIEKGFPGRFFWTTARGWLLDELRLPTGGGYRYEHGGYRFPRRDCVEAPKMEFRKTYFATGVRKRWEIGADGNNRGEPWRYFPNSDWAGGDDGLKYCDPSTEFRNLVVDPMGKATEYFFSIYVHSVPLVGWDARDYGLPITRWVPDPLNAYLPNDQRWLSSRVYQCDAGTFDSSIVDGITLMSRVRRPGLTTECGAPVKETYVRYDYSGITCNDDAEWGPGCTHVNRRLASERTVYHVVDDNSFKGTAEIDSWKSVLNTDYDGFGHYRESRTNGNFGIRNFANKAFPAGDVKVTKTNYNPGAVYNPSTSQVLPFPGIDAPWILNTYDEISAWEENTSYDTSTTTPVVKTFPVPPGTKSVTKFQFDAATGRMTRADKWANASEGTHDVRVLYSREEFGSDRVILKEKYFGGDLQELSGSGWQSNPDYVIAKTLRFGAVEKVQYLNCSDLPLVTTEINEIDPNTGVTLTSTDASGVRTAYGYDDKSRLTRTQRGGDSATVYEYTFQTGLGECTDASYTELPNVGKAPRCSKVKITSEAGATAPESLVFFDHIGRVSAEQRRLPAGWSYKQKTFWANGLLATESTEGAEGGDIHTTKFLRYDALARPTYVVHADSPAAGGRRTEYDYEGVRIVSKTLRGLARKSESTGNSMSSSITTLQYDAQGRLVKLSEPSAGTTNAPMHYQYDVQGRLRVVDAGNQKRFFEYDNRGFLLSESHPELKSEVTGQSPVASWTGTVKYGSYDSRGNHRETYFNTENNRTEFDLTFAYDSLERLETVTASKSGNELKVFEYNDSTAAAGSRQQRKTATRFNIGSKNTRKVVETFSYNGDGRLSGRTVAVDDSLSMTGSFNYDSAGQLQTTQYPQITGHCQGCAAYPAIRPVTNNYTYGMLQSVSEPGRIFASMTYHRNGAIDQLVYHNGVKMNHAIDYWNLPRVTTITTIGALGGAFDSGEYKYDGAGNIQQIGSDVFWYDGVGRLLSSRMSGVNQTFAYDRHGNITNFNGTALSLEGATPSNPDSTTNRLKAATGTTVKYDGAGNLRQWSDPRNASSVYNYDFDALNTLMGVSGSGVGKVYVYSADDERIGVIDSMVGSDWVKETWSFRGPHNQVLRDFVKLKNGWRWKDYIYRGTLPVATVELPQSGGELTRFLHLDHLGSTRLITDTGKNATDSMKFLAFGREMSQTANHTERRLFTGHERDDDGDLAPWGDLDYMHARYYSMMTGRFLSIDPVSGTPERPQTWNRYAYARNNPIKYLDPDGRQPIDAIEVKAIAGPFRVPARQLALDTARGGVGYVHIPANIVEAWAARHGIQIPAGRAGSYLRGRIGEAIAAESGLAGRALPQARELIGGQLRIYDFRLNPVQPAAANTAVAATVEAAAPSVGSRVLGATAKALEFLGSAPAQFIFMFFEAAPAGDPNELEKLEEYRRQYEQQQQAAQQQSAPPQ